MTFISERLRRFDETLDNFLARRHGAAAGMTLYGWASLLVLAGLLLAGSAVLAGGRSQEVIYATQNGSLVSLDAESGESREIYTGDGDADGYATGPSRSGGSRSVAFTVLRGNGEELRGDLYSADLVRETRALTERADSREVIAYPDFSKDRGWILANRYTAGSPPNVLALPASGATKRLLEPDLASARPILAPAWIAEYAIYAWRIGPGETSLTVYNFLERRQATVYKTENWVGVPSYYFDANALLFSERPPGGDLDESRLRLLVGTGTMDVSGMGELGLYDVAPPLPELDDKMAVMWTDSEETGIGLIDPNGWSFSKTGITVEPGSRNPRISPEGIYVATTSANGTEMTIRRLKDGNVVRRVEDVQPLDLLPERMREAGLRVPSEAERLVPANFVWKSFEDQ